MANRPYFIYVDTIDGRDKYYQFSANTNAYSTELMEAMGIVLVPPAGADAVTIGTFADYPIVRVRLTTFGRSFVRLCAANKVGQVLEAPGELEIMGARVIRARVVRKRVRI